MYLSFVHLACPRPRAYCRLFPQLWRAEKRLKCFYFVPLRLIRRPFYRRIVIEAGEVPSVFSFGFYCLLDPGAHQPSLNPLASFNSYRYCGERISPSIDSRHQQFTVRGIQCSMSRPGNCWDNAVVESFFSSLKTELVSSSVSDQTGSADGHLCVHRRIL